MVTQINTLRVSAEMDSASFVAGARAVADSSRAAGESVKGLGDTVKQTDEKIGRAGDLVTRLSRQYIDGYGTAERFSQAISQVSRAVDAGRLSMEQAGAVLDGVYKRYGMMANAAQLAERGQLDLARAVEQANSRFQQQRGIVPANGNGMRPGGFDAGNISAQFNDIAVTAAMGQSPLTIALQQGTQLSQVYGPMGVAGAFEATKVALLGMINPLSIGIIAFTGITAAAIQFFAAEKESARSADEVLSQHRENIKLLGEAFAVAEVKAKAYPQAVASALAGSDVSAMLDKQREAVLAFSAEFGGMITPGKSGAAVFNLDPGFAPFQQAFVKLRADIKEGRDGVEEFVESVSKISRQFPESRTFGDKLLSSENLRQMLEFNNELDRTAETLLRIQSLGVTLDPLGIFGQPIKPSFVAPTPTFENTHLPDGRSTDVTIPQNRPQNFDQPIDSDVTKTLSALQQLNAATDQRIALMRNDVAISGQAVEIQTRLRTEFQLLQEAQQAASRDGRQLTADEINLIKQKAAAIATMTTQLNASRLIQGQNDDLERLRQEASLIGASVDVRARANAALAAEQQLRAQGISLLSQEGQAYVQNAEAMASARVAIERQAAAYTMAQQAGTSMIDQLVQGTGSLEDVANSLLSTFKTMAVTNPLSNSIFGTNLPTLGDLFSGRPAVPGATSTGMMTVNAGTVMVNGAVPGIPGLSTGGGLGSVLGLTPANQNTPLASNMAAYAASVRQMESGSFAGNYSALGPVTESGDRAYGAYQVMGSNVGPWTKEVLGQSMTTEQFLANKAAQDAVFNAKFGQSVDTYGNPQDAASVWFSGRPMTQAGNSADITGTTTPAYIEKFNSNLSQLSTTTAATTSQISTLGASSQQLGGAFGNLLTGMGTPPAASGGGFLASLFGGGSTYSPGYFPPAPTGYADGTNFAPGGWADVGERGKERVYLPRGSQVVPNHKMAGLNDNGRGQTVNVNVHNYGGGSVETQESMDPDGSRRVDVIVEEKVASALSRPGSPARRAMQDQYSVKPRIMKR